MVSVDEVTSIRTYIRNTNKLQTIYTIGMAARTYTSRNGKSTISKLK